MTHEPTFECNDVHCYSCNEDEDGYAYIICRECGHRYRSAGELRRVYRRQFLRTSRQSWFDMKPPPRWRVWWIAVTIRARNIYFCQHCIHDF